MQLLLLVNEYRVATVFMRYAIPQLVLVLLSLDAVVISVYKLIVKLGLVAVVDMIWAVCHTFMLGMVFYFNRYFEPYEPKPIFVELQA